MNTGWFVCCFRRLVMIVVGLWRVVVADVVTAHLRDSTGIFNIGYVVALCRAASVASGWRHRVNRQTQKSPGDFSPGLPLLALASYFPPIVILMVVAVGFSVSSARIFSHSGVCVAESCTASMYSTARAVS